MNNRIPLLLWFGFFGLTACETKEDLQAQVQSLIDQRIAERMETYTRTINQNCQDRIWEEAARIVDSTLIEEARLSKDTIGRPLRPGRPGLPELKQLKDTSPVAPLFPDGLPVEADSVRSKLRPVKKNEGR